MKNHSVDQKIVRKEVLKEVVSLKTSVMFYDSIQWFTLNDVLYWNSKEQYEMLALSSFVHNNVRNTMATSEM